MFRSIVLASLMLFSVSAFAQDAAPNPCANLAEATKGLDSSKIATLLESCRKEAPTALERVANPETANKWADAAKGIGQGIGVAAKELGIAANDFLDSPAGFVVALLLLFNYAGTFLTGLMIAFPLSLISFFVAYKIIRPLFVQKIEYEFTPVLWGAFTRRRVKSITAEDVSEGNGFLSLAYLSGFVILNVIIWANLT